MNVREALRGYAEFAPMTVRDLRGVVRKEVIQVDVLRLATDIERALRAEREAGFLRAALFYYDGGYQKSVRLTAAGVKEEPITAGIAAMVEKS